MSLKERSDNMGIAAMILGIISLVASMIFVLHIELQVPLYFLRVRMPGAAMFPLLNPLTIGGLVSVVGLILGIIALVKSNPNKPMAVAGVVMCSLGLIWPAIGLAMLVGGAGF